MKLFYWVALLLEVVIMLPVMALGFMVEMIRGWFQFGRHMNDIYEEFREDQLYKR